MKKTLFLAILCIANSLQIIQTHPIENKATAITSQYYNAQRAEEMGIFFNYVKEKLSTLPLEIATAQKENPLDTTRLIYLQSLLKTFHIINLIAERNIKALQKMSLEELELKEYQVWQIWVDNDNDRFKDTMGDRLISRILAGTNAIVFALFHSATNQTKEDNEKTVAILELLLDKGLNPNPQAALVFWILNTPTDTNAKDYVSLLSLPQVALMYSFPQVLELILKKGATFGPDINVLDIIDAIKKVKNSESYSYLAEFEPILSNYLIQSQQ